MNKKLIALFAAFLPMLGCNRYAEVPVASSIAISQQWNEISPPQPLHWTHPIEELSFHIDSPHDICSHAEVLLPDGKSVIPDAELVMSDGKIFAMNEHGFWGEEMFLSRDKLPASATVKTIRIRSGVPLHISNLIWRGYDPAKVKR